MPGTRCREPLRDLDDQAATPGLETSVGMYLEDSVADADVPEQHRRAPNSGRLARDLVRRAVRLRARAPPRADPRDRRWRSATTSASGFVLPKFTREPRRRVPRRGRRHRFRDGRRPPARAVIESPEIIHRETREDALLGVQPAARPAPLVSTRGPHHGATDLCSVYGIRRGRDLTIWDVRLRRGACSRTSSTSSAARTGQASSSPGRCGSTSAATSGCSSQVAAHAVRPARREPARRPHHARPRRADPRVVLDKINGLTGKTVIRATTLPPGTPCPSSRTSTPTRPTALEAASPVSVSASRYGNKVNWSARACPGRTVLRAQAFDHRGGHGPHRPAGGDSRTA